MIVKKSPIQLFLIIVLSIFALIASATTAVGDSDYSGGSGTGGGAPGGGGGDWCGNANWYGPTNFNYGTSGSCSRYAPSISSMCNVNDPVGYWLFYFRLYSGADHPGDIFSNLMSGNPPPTAFRTNHKRSELVALVNSTTPNDFKNFIRPNVGWSEAEKNSFVSGLKEYILSYIQKPSLESGFSTNNEYPTGSPIVAFCFNGSSNIATYCPVDSKNPPSAPFKYGLKDKDKIEVKPSGNQTMNQAIMDNCYINTPPPTGGPGGNDSNTQYRYTWGGSEHLQSNGNSSIVWKKTTQYADGFAGVPGRGNLSSPLVTNTNTALETLVYRYGNGAYKSNTAGNASESGYTTSPGNWDSDYQAAVSMGNSLPSPTVNVTTADQTIMGKGAAMNITGITYYGSASISKSQRKLIEEHRTVNVSATAPTCTAREKIPVKNDKGEVIGTKDGDCTNWRYTTSVTFGSWVRSGAPKNWNLNTVYTRDEGNCATRESVANTVSPATGTKNVAGKNPPNVVLPVPVSAPRNSNFNNCTQFFYTTQSQLRNTPYTDSTWSYTANHCKAGIQTGSTVYTDVNYGGAISKATTKNGHATGLTSKDFDSICSARGTTLASSQNDPWIGFRSNQFDGDPEGSGQDGFLNNSDRSYVSTSVFTPQVDETITSPSPSAIMTIVSRNANGTPDVKSVNQPTSKPDNFLLASNTGGQPTASTRSVNNTFVNFSDANDAAKNRTFTLTQWTDPTALDETGLISRSKTGAVWNKQYTDFFAASNWASDPTAPQALSLDYIYRANLRQIVPTSVNWNQSYTSTSRTDSMKVWVHSSRGSTTSPIDYNYVLNNTGSGNSRTASTLNNFGGLQGINLKNYKNSIGTSSDNHLFTLLEFVRSVGN